MKFPKPTRPRAEHRSIRFRTCLHLPSGWRDGYRVPGGERPRRELTTAGTYGKWLLVWRLWRL
jgi:hypothetical protein